MNIKNIIKSAPYWLKVFGTLYILILITGTFKATATINFYIRSIAAFWIAGYVIYKVFGAMFVPSRIPVGIPIPRTSNASHANMSEYDERERLREQREHAAALRNAQEAADSARRTAEHEAWKAQQAASSIDHPLG